MISEQGDLNKVNCMWFVFFDEQVHSQDQFFEEM